MGSALIHASVIGVHFREYWVFGALFAIVAPLQVAWAALVHRRPGDVRLLVTGALGNVAIAAVWVASRSTGLPLGPHAGEPEPVGLKDAVATLDELACAALVALVVLRVAARPPLAALWGLAGVSVVVAILPGGHA